MGILFLLLRVVVNFIKKMDDLYFSIGGMIYFMDWYGSCIDLSI